MTLLPVLPPVPCFPKRPPSEADLIRARLASAERWRRRRRWLRLRAAVFGRAKLAPRGRPETPVLRPAAG
jgi:hypothetical protein